MGATAGLAYGLLATALHGRVYRSNFVPSYLYGVRRVCSCRIFEHTNVPKL
jgi:hypothetical protein